MPDAPPSAPPAGKEIGCIAILFGVNALVIGTIALSFGNGPYSSWEQELWYRYGSLGFLFLGVILPAAALALGARRSQVAMTALVMWMLAVLLVCCGYAINSSGGI